MTRARGWVLLAILLVAAQARAQAEQRALLPVAVNAVPHGDVLSWISGEDVYVPKSFVEQLALPLGGATTRTIGGDVFVSLRSLAPNLTFKIDPEELILSLTVDPRFLGRRVVSLERHSIVEQDRGGDPSLFFNYSLTGQLSRTPSVFTELGASRGNRLFYSGLTRTPDNGFQRGLTYANFDSPRSLRRWTAGDAFVGSDTLGGSVDIGGVTLSRQFSLQPYLIRSPSLDVTGTATTPSTVEVYVNGQMTNRIPVAPGVFTLRDLPVTGGLGDTRLVIRDAFGRETVQEAPFYYSTNVLRKGFSDYVFSAGGIRRDLSHSFSYAGVGTLAQVRRGVTDNLTLGGRFEADRHVVSGGPRVTFSTPLGDFDAAGAASRDQGLSGTAGSLAYRFTAPRVSFGGSATRRSDNYSTLSLPANADRPVRDGNVFASWLVRWFSLGVLANRTEARSGAPFQRVALQSNVPLGRWGNLFASVGRVEHEKRHEPEVLIGLTLSVGHATTADVLLQRTQGRDGARVELRKPLTLANGYGYTLQTDSILDQRFASVQYQTSYGRFELSTDPRKTHDASYLIAGGLVSIGREVLLSRPVQDSYALARVGVPGVRVFASNQEVGRTTAGGDLLIPNLLPHYLNLLRIDDKDVPLEYEVEGVELTVVPPSRGGIVAAFPVHKLRSYSGTMRLMKSGQPVVPALGEIEIRRDGRPMTLPLGRNGEFYVEGLDPGTYPARLLTGGVHCDFRLVLPPADAPLTDLGVIPCAP